jgi:hypothetical protein
LNRKVLPKLIQEVGKRLKKAKNLGDKLMLHWQEPLFWENQLQILQDAYKEIIKS